MKPGHAALTLMPSDSSSAANATVIACATATRSSPPPSRLRRPRCGDAAGSGEAETPGAALTAWLHRFFAFAPSKRLIVSELLEHTDRSNPILNDNRARALAARQPLLAAAQQAHEIRDDLTLEQILDMIVAIAKIHGDSDYLEPMFQATLDGLRPLDGRGRP